MTRCCFDMAIKAASASSLLVASSTDFRRLQRLRISASSSAAPSGVDLNTLQSAIAKKDSSAVKEALDQLTSLMELTTVGIKNAETLAVASVRNDAAFLFTVVGTTGFLGLLPGQLPGDWGFFMPSMLGSISLVNIGCWKHCPWVRVRQSFFLLLQAAISGFSSFFPDYQNRIASHEAAHFLEHVNLIDERLENLIYSRQLDAKELDRLAVVAMAGFAAEGLKDDKVTGQSADLFTLQRFINRSKPQLSKILLDGLDNRGKCFVYLQALFAGSLLKNYKAIHEAIVTAMSNKATVLECIEAIEKAA
ncbi:unnamed protein product [Malus baccata var. baccata]